MAIEYESSSSDSDDDYDITAHIQHLNLGRRHHKDDYDDTTTSRGRQPGNENVRLNFGQYGTSRKQNLRHIPACSNEVNFQARVQDRTSNTRPSSAHRIASSKSADRDIDIDRMKPHPKTDRFHKDKSLTGITVYEIDGKPVEKGAGVFAFKDRKSLAKHDGKCKRNTEHAKCFREIHGKCPEETKGLVATGMSNSKETGLKFNSWTFNDRTKPYVNPEFYGKNTTKEAGKVEQHVTRRAIKAWDEADCPTENWEFSTSRALDKQY